MVTPKSFSGKYNQDCLVYANQIEETAVQQIQRFLDCPAFEGAKIRIMPDVHAGAGAVVGFTSTLTDKVVPNVVGVDIGCGVISFRTLWEEEDLTPGRLQNFDQYLRQHVPSGFGRHIRILPCLQKFVTTWGQEDIRRICKRTNQDYEPVIRSLGTLGGGNHFIELGKDQDGKIWLTIHSGSRNFGLKIAQHHQRVANDGPHKWGDLSWLEGDNKNDYLDDLSGAQAFAEANRLAICIALSRAIPIDPDFGFWSTHNYIDLTEGVIRKGAISATKGTGLVIPWNMRDGLVLGFGKGNPDWNNSAPHGAGRVLGRGRAKRELSLEDFQNDMSDVWSSCVKEETLDESPRVYKPCAEIKEAIEDTVEITHVVKPVYNFKAS